MIKQAQVKSQSKHMKVEGIRNRVGILDQYVSLQTSVHIGMLNTTPCPDWQSRRRYEEVYFPVSVLTSDLWLSG